MGGRAVVRSGDHQRAVDRDVVTGQGRTVAGVLDVRVGWPAGIAVAEVGDPPVSFPDEQFHRAVAGRRLELAHDVEAAGHGVVVEDHQPLPVRGQPGDLRLGQRVARRQDRTVDILLAEHPQHAADAIAPANRHGDDPVAVTEGSGVQLLGEPLHPRARGSRVHHADEVGAPPPQAASRVIALVAQVLGGVEDALAGLFGDRVLPAAPPAEDV
jgi:hypothetical protein